MFYPKINCFFPLFPQHQWDSFERRKMRARKKLEDCFITFIRGWKYTSLPQFVVLRSIAHS